MDILRHDDGTPIFTPYEPFFVAYCPRGYKHEIAVAVFSTLKDAEQFREKIKAPAYALPDDNGEGKQAIHVYKHITARDYKITPLARYTAEKRTGLVLDVGV